VTRTLSTLCHLNVEVLVAGSSFQSQHPVLIIQRITIRVGGFHSRSRCTHLNVSYLPCHVDFQYSKVPVRFISV